MKKDLQKDVITNLRNIYIYINKLLPSSFEQYARMNCEDDFEKLAGNARFQKYVDNLKSFPNRYMEFKRIYHRLLIDIYRNEKNRSFK